jgi:hypothetical protein
MNESLTAQKQVKENQEKDMDLLKSLTKRNIFITGKLELIHESIRNDVTNYLKSIKKDYKA